MLKCESCLSRFQQATDLFQHIQSSCLSFYKKHPEHWAEILSKMTVPANNLENNQITSGDNYSHSEEMSQSSQTSSKSPAQAKQKKEPPFCIMFKAQKVKKGQPAKSMHMTVADYFYGQIDGKSLPMKKIKRVCKCTDCGKALRNNIRLMSHARHKIVNGWEEKEVNDTKNICYHCYKEYNSPFLLQCHLENVHGAVPASSTCKICEVHFPTDREFLIHMKDHHVQNEAPYSCKVCTYRSSVHSDVMKHFRDQHIDTTALMCPFCLAMCYAGNAYLKHVLQHKKSGYACSKCRLIFNSTAERAAHLRSDHKSNYMKEKVTKFKNYHLCQIYVRVAPYKDEKPDDILKTGSKRPFVHEGPVRHTKMLRSPDSDELPTYLYPVKRSNCVRKVSVALPKGSTGKLRCAECHEKLEATSVDLRDHFRYQHECRWCVYVTSCEKASHDHVLRDHADDEMREQIFGKTDNEETKFPIILQDDDDDDPILSNIKEEPPEDILPIPTDSFEETKPELPPIPDAPEISPPTKGRRKQPNPMKIADIFQPRAVVKPPKKDRCVQTNGLEKEKGVQACDEDFKNLHGNTSVVDSDNANPQGKRRRKVLAQPGYFPDIDDDDGWAKYFASVDKEPAANKSAKSSMLSLNAMHWPSMVPRQGTFSILNRALQSQQTGSRADSCKPDTSKPRYQFHMYGEKMGATGANGPQLSITGQAGGQLTNKLQTILRSAPLPPRNLRCNGCTHETMLVQWDPPANNAVTQYKITFQGVGPHTTQLLPLNQTLVKLVGLKPDVMYAVRVHTLFYTAVSEFANIFVKTEPTPRNARARKPSSTVATSTKTTTSVARRPQSAGSQTTSSKTVPLSSNHSRPLSQISTARIPVTAVYPNEPGIATKLLTVSSQGTSSRVVATQNVSRGVAAASSAAVSSQHETSNASFSSVKQFLKVPVASRGGELSKNNNDVVFLKLDDNKKTQKSDVLVRTVAKSDKTESCNDVILVLDDDNETFKVTKCDKPVATKQKSNGPVDSDSEVICVDTTDATNPESSTEKSVEGGKSEVSQQTKRIIEVNSEPTRALPAGTGESSLTDSCSSQSNDKMTENKAVTGVGDCKQDNNNCVSRLAKNNDIVLEDGDASKNGTQESVATARGEVALPSTDSVVSGESQTNLMLYSSKNEKKDTVKVGSDAEDEKSKNVSMPSTDPVILPKNSSGNENGAVAADCKVCTEETDTQRQDEAAVPPKSNDDSGPPSNSCSNVPDICISKEDSAETSSTALATESSNVLESVEDLANPGREDESETSKAMLDAQQELDSAMKDIGGDLHADSSKPTEAASSADSDTTVTNGSEGLVSGALKQPDDESRAVDGTIPMDCSSDDIGNVTENGVTNDEPNNVEALQQTIRQDDLEEEVTDMSDDFMIPEADIMNAVNDEDISMDDISELLGDAAASWI